MHLSANVCNGTAHARLEAGEVRVWLASEDCFVKRGWVADAARVLNESERKRAQQFRRDADRRRFEAARGGLRWLISGATGTPPESIRFHAGAHGKPFHAAEFPVRFNVSHTEQLIAWGLATDFEVGVDAEKAKAVVLDEAATRRHFHAMTCADIESAGPDGRSRRFIEHWVLTEAYVKAIGTGLGTKLDAFRFAFDPADRSRMAFHRCGSDAADPWSFWLFGLGDEFRLAIAAAASPARLRIDTLGDPVRESLACIARTPGCEWEEVPRSSG